MPAFKDTGPLPSCLLAPIEVKLLPFEKPRPAPKVVGPPNTLLASKDVKVLPFEKPSPAFKVLGHPPNPLLTPKEVKLLPVLC